MSSATKPDALYVAERVGRDVRVVRKTAGEHDVIGRLASFDGHTLVIETWDRKRSEQRVEFAELAALYVRG